MTDVDDWAPLAPAGGGDDDWAPLSAAPAQTASTQPAPDDLTSQHVAAASAAAGRPIQPYQLGENAPGETVGEILPISRDAAGYHLAVPGFARGALSVGSRLAGLEPYANPDQLSPREQSAVGMFGLAAPGRVPGTAPWWEGFRPSGEPPAPAPSGALEIAPPERPGGPGAAATAPAPAGTPYAPPPPPAPVPGAPAGWQTTLGNPATIDQALTSGKNALLRAIQAGEPEHVQQAILDAMHDARVAFGVPTSPIAPAAPPGAPPPAGAAPAAAPSPAAGTATATAERPTFTPQPSATATGVAVPEAPPPSAAQTETPQGARTGAAAAEGAGGAPGSTTTTTINGVSRTTSSSPVAPPPIPPMPAMPRPIAVIQREDNVTAHTATQTRRTEEDAWLKWHNDNLPGFNPLIEAAGEPTPDAQAKAASVTAAVHSPATADEILQGANYPQTKAQVDDVKPYLPEGYSIAHEPGLGWALYGPDGTPIAGSRIVAPTADHIMDMVAFAQAQEAAAHAPPHPATAIQGGTRVAPVVVQTPQDIHAAAVQAAEPTPAQAAAGNQRKGHIVIDGLPITIENHAGSIRTDKHNNPPRWQVTMPADYGYVKRSQGADGDQVDVYLGPNAHNAHNLPVFVVDQRDSTTGAFDEHKVMLGFPSLASARTVYYAGHSDGLGGARLGAISQMTWQQFRAKLKAGGFEKSHAYRTPEQHVRAAMAEMGVTPDADLVATAVGYMQNGSGPHEAVLFATRLAAQYVEGELNGAFDKLLSETRANAKKLETELAAEAPPGSKFGARSFTTAKGSTYQVHEDGTTTRNKAFRPEHGVEQQGWQPRSERTFYVTNESAQKLGEFQTKGGPAKAIHPVASKPGFVGVRYLSGGDGGKFEQRTVVRMHDKPAVGLIPVEVWQDGQRVHFGNPITVVSTEDIIHERQPEPRPAVGEQPAAASEPATGPVSTAAPAGEVGGGQPGGGGQVPGAPVEQPVRPGAGPGGERGQPVPAESAEPGNGAGAGAPGAAGENGNAEPGRAGDGAEGAAGEAHTAGLTPREQASEKFLRSPKGPFVEGRIAATASVDPRLVQYARQFTQMVGLGGVRIFIADPDDIDDTIAAARKYDLYGPYLPIVGISAQAGRTAAVRRLSNGAYVIALPKQARQSAAIEALAHEIGHILEREGFEKATAGEKAEINGAFGKWLQQHAPDKVSDYIRALRAHTTGKKAPNDDRDNAVLPDYWRSFQEWFADQVARWATTDEKPLSLLDKLFARIADGYRKLAAAVAGGRYKADAVMARWLNERTPAETEGAPPPSTGPPEPATAAAQPEKQYAEGPDVRVANDVARRLGDWATPITARGLQQVADEAYGGTLASGAYSRDRLYDAIELGVNLFISRRANAFAPDGSAAEAAAKAQILSGIKERLPTQTVRAGEKDALQQFSTPPDFAFAAAWVANIRPNADVVLEPSAGVGGIAVFAKIAGAKAVHTNELSAKRRGMLQAFDFTTVSAENAEQIDNTLPPEIKPTVVVMNPPFSVAATRMGGKMVLGAGARHVEQALERLQPGGRLVAIVGRGMAMGAPAFRDWWKKIGNEYDVRANVGVGGNVYRKYGTTFETRLLVIDKTRPSHQAPIGGDVDQISDLIAKLEGIRDDRPTAVRGSGVELPASQPASAPVAAGGEGAGVAGAGVPAATGAVGTGQRPGSVASPGPEPSEPGGPATPAGAAAAAGTGSGEPLNGLVPEQPEPRPVGAGGDAGGGTVAGEKPAASSAGAAGSGARPDGGGSELAPTGEAATLEQAVTDPHQTDITESVYEAYKPQRITIKGAKEHLGALVQSAAMASVLPPETSYTPSIPAKLIKDGALSDAQLEAVTYAGHAHSQELPASDMANPKRRRGFFIGDGTGVGKGREVAGIILDNWQQGRRKALWVSEKRPLLNDARRDWKGLGQNPDDVFDLGAIKAGDAVKPTQGIAFTTYDTLKSAEQIKNPKGEKTKGKTRLQQIVDWVGKDFDGVIAFDEAHNLGNAVEMAGKRGKTKPAAKALAGVDLQKALPNARVVYVSATGATEVSNLAYADRLGLWGRGTAFANREDFLSKIATGGIAAMELVARDMKALGYYVARNLSYDGVEYDRLEHKLTDNQRDIYDKMAEGWQLVLQNIGAALKETQADKNSQAKSAAMAQFWGAHQRFFNQVITSMQMPTMIQGIERDVAEGRQAVVQLVNTMEAAQERAVEKARENDEDLEDLDMTPRDQLMQMIEKSFPVVEHELYTDENGNVRSRPVTDANGNLVLNKRAVAMRERLLDELGSLRVPDGPMEILFNHFGIDRVAEVTGRKQRVVRKPDEKGEMRTVVEKRPAAANVAEANLFQGGQKPILVFSDAGGTGRSYHAENGSGSAGKRRSHYLAQPGWRADKAVQGFGRTHRTNQASAPIFHLVTTDLQGQRRFISSIARRLAQLGALTKGERRAGDQGMFGMKDNLESEEAKAALRQFITELVAGDIKGLHASELQKAMGLKLVEENGAVNVPEMSQFLNRLLSLTVDHQNQVFDAFGQRLDETIERAASRGTLDTGVETFKADKIEKASDQVVYRDPTSGAETRHVQLTVSKRNHPIDFETVERQRAPKFYVRSARTSKVFAVSDATSMTDAKGNIVPQYRLTGPTDYAYIDADRVDSDRSGNWTKIRDKDKALEAWSQQVKDTPEFHTSDLHVITGAVLPIWDRLKGNPQIYRLQTATGERLLGRVLDTKSVTATLQALGAQPGAVTAKPEEVLQRILSGDTVRLANAWFIKRSLVSGERRIELVGPDYRYGDQLAGDGVFTERIQHRTRYFLPTGERAQAVLEAITKEWPVANIEAAAGEDLQQMLPAPKPGEEPAPYAPKSWDDIEEDNPDAPWFHQMALPPALPPQETATRDRVDTLIRRIPKVGNSLAVFAAKALDVTDAVQMAVSPMASVSATAGTRRMAKQFANTRRYGRWAAGRAIEALEREFPVDRLKAMWEAADIESVNAQALTTGMGPHVPVAAGFASLSPRELEVVQAAMDASQHAFDRARAAGKIKSDPLPFYVPRLVVDIGMPNVRVVRDIRTLILATLDLEEAVAGHLLIKRIEAAGRQSGSQTVSYGHKPGNIDPLTGLHSSSARLLHRKNLTVEETEEQARHIELRGDDGFAWRTIEQNRAFMRWTVKGTKADGSPAWVQEPIYVRSDFIGPLRAVLRRPTHVAVRGMLELKGKMMTSIMYGITHLAVIAGRAVPVTKNPIPIKFMREGAVAMLNPEIMRRAIETGGLDPIGKRWAFRGEMGDGGDMFDIRPGRSWTAQILALVMRPYGKGASEATKRGVDAAGDYLHNRLLWERIGALQMGIYMHFEREGLANKKSPNEAAVMAAHMANRFAGALPQESMSQFVSTAANLLLFSRSYRLGNLGAVKDALIGPPRDVQAMVAPGRKVAFTAYVRRAMRIALTLDLLFYNFGSDALQSWFDVENLGKSVSEEAAGYVRRAEKEGAYLIQHPWQILNPVHMLLTAPHELSPMSEHEPLKENRILVGFEKDGTGIYIRPGLGKFVEDVSDYFTRPIDTLHSMMSPFAKMAEGIFENRKGTTDQRVYDPYIDTTAKEMRMVGDLAQFVAENSGPTTAIKAGSRIAEAIAAGEAPKWFDVGQVVGGGLGFSFSHGYPGGPLEGFKHQARKDKAYEIERAMPSIRDLIRSGPDGQREAVLKMRELGMSPFSRREVIHFTLKPSAGAAGLRRIKEGLPVEQQEMLDAALADWLKTQQANRAASP